MATVIKAVSFDAADALALATFWAAALGSDVDEDSTEVMASPSVPGRNHIPMIRAGPGRLSM